MNLSNFQDESSSCQFTRTLYGENKETKLCNENSKTVAAHARRFAHGHWSFLGLGSQKKWYGTHTYKPNGKWDRVAGDMMLFFNESGHPVFRGIISVNQLSVCGAVADMCDELAWRISSCSESTGKHVAENNSETNRIVDNEQTTSD